MRYLGHTDNKYITTNNKNQKKRSRFFKDAFKLNLLIMVLERIFKNNLILNGNEWKKKKQLTSPNNSIVSKF